MNIIIIKFNQPDFERACIESVKKYTDLEKHTLTIYDNYKKKENLAVVWNRLIEESEDQNICLLNSDTLVEEGWERLEEALSAKETGAVGPVTNKCGTVQKGMLKLDKIEDINDLSGFCYLFRKKVWREVGKFPEDMPFYGQETVFNRKIQDHGYKLKVDRRVFIYHAKGQSWLKARDNGDISDEHREYARMHYYNYVRRLKDLRESIPSETRVVFLGAGSGNCYPTFKGIDQTISDYFGNRAVHLPMETSADTILAFAPDILIVVNTRYKEEWYNEIKKVKRAGVKTALYWMDLRAPSHSNFTTRFSHTLEKHFDKIFFCAKGWCEDWEEVFKVKTEWLPQATIQHPIPPRGEKHKVLHIGDLQNHKYHSNRINLINQLRVHGVTVTNINSSARDKRQEISKASYGLYGSADYTLSISPIIEGYTSDRTYHIMGAGGVALVLDPGGLEHLKDYVKFFKDGGEAKKLLEEDVDETFKKRVFEYAQSNHLYKDRYIKIIKELCDTI